MIELIAKVTGPVAAQLDAAFRTDWYSELVFCSTRTAHQKPYWYRWRLEMCCARCSSGSWFREREQPEAVPISLIHAARKTLVITESVFCARRLVDDGNHECGPAGGRRQADQLGGG